MSPKMKRRPKKPKSKPKTRSNVSSTVSDSDDTERPDQVTEELLGRILYRWYQKFLRKKHVDVGLKAEDLLVKARAIIDKVDCVANLTESLNLSWIRNWQKQYGVCTELDEEEGEEGEEVIPLSLVNGIGKPQQHSIDLSVNPGIVSPQPELAPEVIPRQIEEYTNDQIYYVYWHTFLIKDVPDKSYEELAVASDRVSVLMAGNRSGSHRTRVLVTGREWRPACLQHVNMVTQPVVYAGGGSGAITPDLFKWWFHKEFQPVVAMLHAKVILYSNNTSFLNALTDDTTTNVTVQFLAQDDQSLQNSFNIVIFEFRTLFATMVLRNFLSFKSDEMTFTGYLKALTLKDAFLLIHYAWLKIRPESFQRAWLSTSITMDTNDPPKRQKLIFISYGSDHDLQGDNNLLLELQWLTHDLGLEVTDDDLITWIKSQRRNNWLYGIGSVISVKVEEEEVVVVPGKVETVGGVEEEEVVEGVVGDGGRGVSVTEVVGHLEKVIHWMETEPFDSNMLLCMQDILAFAKKVNQYTDDFVC